MTIGEVMNIGENAGKQYVDEIAENIVKKLIEARIYTIKKKINEESDKKTLKKIHEKMICLEQAESMDFYKVLVNETRNKLMNHFRNVADSTNVNLINAEYFDFSGRLR